MIFDQWTLLKMIGGRLALVGLNLVVWVVALGLLGLGIASVIGTATGSRCP